MSLINRKEVYRCTSIRNTLATFMSILSISAPSSKFRCLASHEHSPVLVLKFTVRTHPSSSTVTPDITSIGHLSLFNETTSLS